MWEPGKLIEGTDLAAVASGRDRQKRATRPGLAFQMPPRWWNHVVSDCTETGRRGKHRQDRRDEVSDRATTRLSVRREQVQSGGGSGFVCRIGLFLGGLRLRSGRQARHH